MLPEVGVELHDVVAGQQAVQAFREFILGLLGRDRAVLLADLVDRGC
jgi:hypothetical protein